MKRWIACLIVFAMLLTLTACAGEEKNDGETQVEAEAPKYSFTYQGVELVPGAEFDPAALPEADFVYEVPSCAIEGTDNVYSYGVMEVTAFDDGTGEIIYSVYISDANTPTDEGLYIGDDMATVESLYGTDYTQLDTQVTYQSGNSYLVLLVENDVVISIEYRMVTE